MLWPLVVNRDCLSRILLAPTAQSRSCHYGAGAYSVDESTQVHVLLEGIELGEQRTSKEV